MQKKTQQQQHKQNRVCILHISYLYDFSLPHGCCPHTRWNEENNKCESESYLILLILEHI